MTARGFNPVFSDRPESIFPTMTRLARQHGSINLGQGFPDEDGPKDILDVAAQSILAGPNQYSLVEGTLDLREAIAADNKRFYGLDIDPAEETLVVAGATEGLAAAFMGFLTPGDEAVLFAPFYECYAPQIEATGANIRFVDLKPPHWTFTAEALETAITPKTRLIVLNSPHNPLGRVLTRAELEMIAAAARKHDLIIVCDEVYEHLVFEGHQHIPIMTLDGMFERTVRIGSAGKTFSLTGVRIGYITGPAHLVMAIKKAHTHLAYTCPAPLQDAVAYGLRLGDAYYQSFVADMDMKRGLLTKGLEAAGLELLPCEGTYFITADIRSVGWQDDLEFCRTITVEAGVTAVPISAFYHPDNVNPAQTYARFCFCKKPEVLEAACDQLIHYFQNR